MKDDLRRQPSGFSDLGVIFPYGVSHIILRDLDDNSRWAISWSVAVPTVDGYGYISITDNLRLAHREGYVEYEQNSGPLLHDGEFMLILRGGRLGIAEVPLPVGEQKATSTKPYAKNEFQQPRLIYMGDDQHYVRWTPEFRS